MPSQKYLEKKNAQNVQQNQQRVNAVKQAFEPEVKQVMIQKQQASGVVPGVEKNTVSVAKNISTAGISSAMKIDINLETQLLGQLMDNTLKITVNNTTLADITPPKLAQEMFSIKILSNDGNSPICELTKETLMYPLRFIDPSTLARYKRGYESNNTTITETETVSIVETTVDGVIANEVVREVVSTVNPEVIAPGESRTWYIPLLADPFAINEVFMQAVQGSLVYKVEFDKSAWVGGYPDLTGLKIISRHLYYEQDIMDARKITDMGAIRDYNFRSYVVKNPTQVITANGNLEFNLDGFTKRASEVFLQLWKNGEHLVDLGNYIDSYDITDAGNNSLIASGPIDSVYDDVILGAAHSYEPVIGATSDSWTVISFSPETASDFASGESHGQRLFTGKELLKLKISSSLPSTGYQLRIYYGELNKMQSVGGVFKLTN